MPASLTREAPRTVHLFPKADGWILMSGDRGEHGTHFADLGRALDVATSGERPIHVVVHERGAA